MNDSFARLFVATVQIISFVLISMVVGGLFVGCQTVPPRTPEVKVLGEVLTMDPIKTPVVTPCLTADKIPAPPPTWARMTQSDFQLEKAARLDLLELKDYLVVTQTLLWGCVKDLEAGPVKPPTTTEKPK